MNEEQNKPLLLSNVHPDPFQQFIRWYQQADQAGISLPNAMCLATSTQHGKPSARMVLLKDVDEHGFVFYSNYQSRKAIELEKNPFASLVFYSYIVIPQA